MTLQSDEIGTSIRDLKSDRVGKLVKIPGIVVAATGIKAKATRITIQCRSCRTTLPNLGIRPGGKEQGLSAVKWEGTVVQCFGSGQDLVSIKSVDPDPDSKSGSGFRGGKNDPRK